MSKTPKIMVIKRKELIYTGIFLLIGILLIVLLVWLFSKKNEREIPVSSAPVENNGAETNRFESGIYTASLMLNNSILEMEVVVSEGKISKISIKNMDDAIKTMYPLIETCLLDLEKQVISTQSLQDITYPEDCRYTYLILLDGITSALSKAVHS